MALTEVGTRHSPSPGRFGATLIGMHVTPDALVPVGLHVETSASFGANEVDLLIIGAYGHTRLRELIFGGATRHLLRDAALPVLFGG